MFQVEGYKPEGTLSHKKETIVYRATREKDLLPVIIKTYRKNHLTEREIAALRQEYEILRNLNTRGIAKTVAFVSQATSAALILENIGGQVLSQCIPSGGMEPDLFLWIAMEMSDIISALHQAGIIHKEIHPDFFCINKETRQIRLIDAAHALVTPQESARPASLRKASLAYISPEQTGRMNRQLDCRTDFYSLGVMFFQILIGRLPFSKTDPLELVHCHLAKQPVTPCEINQKIPGVLSDIVMKLMAKAAEDRYQSAWGLKADLKTCRECLRPNGTIAAFPLGKKDTPYKFQVSKKLYGRNDEIATMLDIFAEVCHGQTAILTVSGYAGVGKTSLVHEIYKSIAREKGYFISVTFSEFRRSTPYQAFQEAFSDLIKEILAESEERIRYWKEKLLKALGANGQIIIDVIPEVELIVGPQPPLQQMDPVSSTNRTNLVFFNFIRTFCEQAHPLVLCLDDLQWADSATLKSLELILNDETLHHLFLIGTYRDNEVNETHPLTTTLTAMRKLENRHHLIQLMPLTMDHTTCLIADTLRCDTKSAKPLAEMVLSKTNGNPFFINQFLAILYDEGLLSFDAEFEKWTWSLSTIRSHGITSNMATLLVCRIKVLPPDTQQFLRFASCIGHLFNLDLLAKLVGVDVSMVRQHLIPAVQAGLIIPFATNPVSEETRSANDRPGHMFKFQHSHVHQAVYETMDEHKQKNIHLKIGRLLQQSPQKTNWAEDIFEVVNNLNAAIDLIALPRERLELAGLNLMAGKKARKAAAIEPAYRYYKRGVALLSEDSWQSDYELALALYEGGVEAAGLGGHYDQIDLWFDLLKRNTRDVLDQIPAHRNVIQTCISQNKLQDALNTAQKILQPLGFELPGQPTLSDAQDALEAVRKKMAGRSIEDLLSLPEMTDPHMRAAMNIFTAIISAAFIAKPHLFSVILCKQIYITIQYGLTPEAAFSFCAYSTLLYSMAGDFDAGHRFGQLGLKMIDRPNAKKYQTKVCHALSLVVTHWKQPIRETLEISSAGFHSGIEFGDFEYAGYNLYCQSMSLLLAGEDLKATAQKMAYNGVALRKINQKTALAFNEIFRQAALNLLGQSEMPTLLIGSAYDERRMIPRHYASGDWLASFYTHLTKLMLCYYFEEREQAYKIVDLVETEKETSWGYSAFPIIVFHFYDSLVRLSVYPTASGGEQKTILEKVSANQEKMKTWSNHAPMNFLNKYHLVEAETLRVQGDGMLATMHYRLAVNAAKENKFTQEEALANELTAKFWLEKENNELASLYMQKAYAAYTRWGATGKTSQLSEKYPQLLDPEALRHGFLPSVHAADQTQWPTKKSQGFDLSTMIKASQAISSEIEIDKLLTTLIRIVIENAGAQSGLLILESQGRLLIEARGTIENGGIVVRPPAPVDEENVPVSIIEYIARTKDVLVLENAMEDGRFGNGAYIRSQRPKSVLCSPILHKSKMVGIFYLENRLVSRMFTPQRLELLKILTTQMAISIENAKLFQDLKKAEKKYRGIFENAVEGIFQTSPDGNLISINPAFAHSLGYESTEDVIQHVKNVEHDLYVHPEKRKDFLELVRTQDTVTGFEVEFYRKDRSRLWVSLHARPVYDQTGDLRYIEGLVTDISEQCRIREALRESEKHLRLENILLRSNIKDRYRFGDIIGKSPPMQEVYELILKASVSDTNVIVYGESGTGKELVARAIHDSGHRKARNFVPVNCGAIPKNLLESEFFGYKKGAFTGAVRDKAGFLDQANGGTLFLDEMGEIDLNIQVKLLRVLEGSGFMPVGSSEAKNPDVRIIAATNRDLQEHVRKGLMREDFFYRIHIIPIQLPPLRERKEDIPLLIEHFMKELGKNKGVSPLPLKALEAMHRYHWPGNIRELQNTIHRYITLNKLDLMQPLVADEPILAEISETIMDDTSEMDFNTAVAEFEKKIIARALEQNQWHKEKAISSLGIPRRTFFRKLSKFGLIQ